MRIQMEDTVRDEAADAVRELKAQGITRTVLLTGDSELSAQQVADAAGIDTIHFGLQPEEKAAKMDFLMRTIPTDGAEAYIGDGIHLNEYGSRLVAKTVANTIQK